MKISPVLFFISIFPSLANAGTIDKDFGASLEGFYGYTDYSNPYNKIYKQNNLNSVLNLYGRATYDFDNNYALSLMGYFMADSSKEIENYNQGVLGEEIFSIIETPYGELNVGQDKNVAYNFAVGAPDTNVFHSQNTDLANFINNPNWYKKGSRTVYKTLDSTYINTDGSALKINYTTPEFWGVKLGASFVPETYSRSGLVAKQAEYKDNSAYILGAYGAWDVLGYELETSLGFADYRENDSEYSAGVSIYRKGWTVGASYRKTEVKSNDYVINKDTFFDAYREGRAYNIGVGYTFGPITTAITYFESKADHIKLSNKVTSFSNKYQYNKNMAFSLTIAHLKAEEGKLQKDSKGYAFILGMELSL